MGDVLDRARDEEVMVYAIGLESEFFNGQRRVRTRPDRGLEEACGGNRRRVFRAEEDRRPRADVHARRAGAAQPVHARFHPGDARRPRAQAGGADENAGNDRPGAEDLHRLAGTAVGTGLIVHVCCSTLERDF